MAISNLQLPKDADVCTVRKMNTPPISSLIKKDADGGIVKTECHKFIKAMIAILNQYFGVAWNDFQLTEIAQDFYSEYHYWTLADWKLFSRKCKLMYFADEQRGMMGFFSPDKLMSWAARYDQEWIRHSQMISEGHHNILCREERLCTKEDRMKADDDARKIHALDLERFKNETQSQAEGAA